MHAEAATVVQKSNVVGILFVIFFLSKVLGVLNDIIYVENQQISQQKYYQKFVYWGVSEGTPIVGIRNSSQVIGILEDFL